ncbi:MAG: cyclodeaminase/cyclohydrolase family protein [Clostridia bacterium]|nr:cyclodeaminase/cyclohydrolase family protein [Clostridia bacterium]
MTEEFTQKTCRQFVEALGSREPVPGGGGAAALAGAIGTALGHMVCSLTLGKERYAAVAGEIETAKEECEALESALLEQVEEDAKGFAPLAQAYRIPRDRPDREQRLEEATLCACEAPMRIMELCCRAIDVIAKIAESGARYAISDAGCGVVCCKAALQSAALNVFINTKALRDRSTAEAMNARVSAMLETWCPRADSLYDSILNGLTE